MAQCTRCGKKGIFLKVNSEGLCNKCQNLLCTESIKIAKQKEQDAKEKRKEFLLDIIHKYKKFSFDNSSMDFQTRIKGLKNILHKFDEVKDNELYNKALIELVMEKGENNTAHFYLWPIMILLEKGIPREKNYLSELYDMIKKKTSSLELEEKNLLAFIEIKEKLVYSSITLSRKPVERNRLSDMPNIVFSNITKRTNKNLLYKYITIDIETTGLKTRGDEILEIAAVRFEDFEAVEAFTTFIKPKKEIPPSATTINGITDDMVANAPKIYEVIPALNDFLANYPIVGHNLIFDLKFLFSFGLDCFAVKRKYFDTLSIYKKFNPDAYSFKLDSICEDIKIIRPASHRALDDALASGILFQSLLDKICD